MSFPATLNYRSHSTRFNEKAQSYQLFISGADQESAAAWLAAALQPSPQARRKNGGLLHLTTNGLAHSNLSGTISMIKSNISVQSNLNTITKCNNTNDNGYSHHLNDQHLYKSNISSIQSVKPVKPLQPFGKDDRVRRMSILRPSTNHNLVQPNQINNCPKKRVSFADANGMQLENIRYYEVKPPIHRRYSSYNAPTYLTNGNYNSPWNLALNGNVSDRKPFNIRSETSISTPINTNITTTNATTSASTITAAAATTITTTMLTSNQLVKEYDFNHSKLAPRYELMASNFTSPSLQLNFTETLSKKSVLLHSLTTAETTVYGTVSVMNVHFSKRVIVRYTFNEWKSHIEREATYMLGSHDGQSDKFSFVIYARPEDFSNNLATTFSVHHSGTYLANGADPIQSIHPRIYFAIRFIAGDGREFWDNNDGRNYCLNLTTY
ncbi:hypothetical protein BLOT_015799 [Blomia tropicalis]|nr:hypothetical protein BLOT_015799 [Blomia tropicalis]